MPRVLRIINRLNLGGPTYNAANLTKYIDGEFETLLVSGMTDGTEESSEFILQRLDLHQVYIKEMYRELNPFRDYKAYFRLRQIIRDFKPDIVHTHAATQGKYSPDINDVKAVALPILSHLVFKNYKAEAEGLTIEKIIRDLF